MLTIIHNLNSKSSNLNHQASRKHFTMQHCKNCMCKHFACLQEPVVMKHRAQRRSSGNIVTIREGFQLKVSADFFNSYNKKGSTFKLNIIHQHGQMIAVKWLRDSHDCNYGKHSRNLMKASDITSALISSFEARVDIKGWKIRVVKPVIPGGVKEIGLEPYVKNLERFNTNTFWETQTSRTYQKLVLAFSHFSYVASKGKYVLTNLVGGVDENKRIVTLLSPTIVSGNAGSYGCADLGNVGRFSGYHSCNSFCKYMPKRRKGCNKNGGFEFIH